MTEATHKLNHGSNSWIIDSCLITLNKRELIAAPAIAKRVNSFRRLFRVLFVLFAALPAMNVLPEVETLQRQ